MSNRVRVSQTPQRRLVTLNATAPAECVESELVPASAQPTVTMLVVEGDDELSAAHFSSSLVVRMAASYTHGEEVLPTSGRALVSDWQANRTAASQRNRPLPGEANVIRSTCLSLLALPSHLCRPQSLDGAACVLASAGTKTSR